MSHFSFSDLRSKQELLKRKVIVKDCLKRVRLIGGCDVCYRKKGEKTFVKAGIVVLTFPSLHVVDKVVFETETDFPYVPGFLSFREMPSLKECFKKLQKKPDLLLVDGQGLAHFRKFGLACHLGVELNIPTIGCAKKRLVGEYKTFKWEKGEFTPLYYQKEVVGRVVCTRSKVKPVFVSVGHKVTLSSATKIVLKCSSQYRIPEPLRLADHLVSHGVML